MQVQIPVALPSFVGSPSPDRSPTPLHLEADKNGTQNMLAVMLFVRSN